jgi:hypothetical protein
VKQAPHMFIIYTIRAFPRPNGFQKKNYVSHHDIKVKKIPLLNCEGILQSDKTQFSLKNVCKPALTFLWLWSPIF